MPLHPMFGLHPTPRSRSLDLGADCHLRLMCIRHKALPAEPNPSHPINPVGGVEKEVIRVGCSHIRTVSSGPGRSLDSRLCIHMLLLLLRRHRKHTSCIPHDAPAPQKCVDLFRQKVRAPLHLGVGIYEINHCVQFHRGFAQCIYDVVCKIHTVSRNSLM